MFWQNSPFHSWRNPVERVMSILNIGLQCIGLVHEFEEEVAKCNTLADLRNRLKGLKIQDNLSPVIILLSTIFT